jgi:alpha/beta superfamily hydrolase
MSQPPADRYQAEIFDNVVETTSVLFSTGVPRPNRGGGFYEFITGYPLNVDEYDTSPVNLYMNIFEPAGDTLSQRPVIIICFGGGFLSGSKDHWSIRLLCIQLAKLGFVTAAIDYRLGMNVFDSDLAMRAVYRALQDARSAVRFFRADADNLNTFRVDPEKIFLGGHSSGAFAALHNAYLNDEDERPISTFSWTQDGNPVSDQGCLDCAGDNPTYNGHANAIFSLAGALGFTDFIDTSTDPKVVMFHSTDDETVPYTSGGPFGSIIFLVIGSDLPPVYGSLPISQRCQEVGLPYQFYSYTNRGHGVHEDGETQLYPDIIPGISNWFFEQELKPTEDTIVGNQTICSSALQQSYYIEPHSNTYFDWQLNGGGFMSMSTSAPEVTVVWDSNAIDRSLLVIPYSHLDAKGDTAKLDIDVVDNITKMFQYAGNTWEDTLNWDAGELPSSCHDVIFNASAIPFNLTLSSGVSVNSLILGENIFLNITSNGSLVVDQQNPTNSSFAIELQGRILNDGILNTNHVSEEKSLNIQPTGFLENKGILRVGKEN